MINRKNRTGNNIFRKTGILLILAVLFLCPLRGRAEAVGLDRLEIPEQPETEAWYRITPEGAVSADGSPWHGMFKKGTEENKVLVWFYGGGVSVDEETASRPGTFYTARLGHDGDERKGIGSGNGLNPFRTWTVLELPYSTADFHLGEGEFRYSTPAGEERTVYHHGYQNFRSYMEKAAPYLDHPDTVVIAGCSAGGFGAAMLADEILTDYFPEAENTTVLIESALLLRDDWKEIAENIWQAPEHLTRAIRTDNLTLDGLRQLSADHPDTKILFSSSCRDCTLSAFQHYFETGKTEYSSETGDVYEKNLRHFVSELQKLPNTAVFIWKEYYLLADLTGHIFMDTDTFFLHELDRTSTLADWLRDAVNGTIRSLGTELPE